MNKITEQQFYDLLSLKLSGDATARELELLQEQLLLNPQWQFLYDQMMRPHTPLTDEDRTQQAFAAHFVKMQLQGKLKEDGYSTAGNRPVADNQNTISSDSPAGNSPSSAGNSPSSAGNSPSSAGSSQSLAGRSHSRSLSRKLALAGLALASLIGVLFFASTHQQDTRPPAPALNEIATKKGSKSNIKLPDGTEVWLNAESKLSYKENFTGKTREVTLMGEAYFDVAHDTSHPFVINTGRARIRVLGTAFNVRNYPQEKTIETTLMRGKLEISLSDHPDQKLILKPFEKLIVAKGADGESKIAGKDKGPAAAHLSDKVVLTSVTYSTTDSLIAETSWVNDKMVFVNQPLEKIAEELERHFAVTILFRDPGVKGYRYTGVFSDESLDKILEIIQLSKKINYETDGRKIIIQ